MCVWPFPSSAWGLIFPVTGGTGVFAGARGTLTIIGQDPKRTANTYALTYVHAS